jgi:hypothetical protein
VRLLVVVGGALSALLMAWGASRGDAAAVLIGLVLLACTLMVALGRR